MNTESTDSRAEPGVSANEPAPTPSDRDGWSPDEASSEDDPSSQISVFLVDDHPPIRTAAETAVEAAIDLRACGHASSIESAVEKIGEVSPDVVVVDLSLPDGHGLDLVQDLRERYPVVSIVIFSMYDESIYAERAIRAGASGYVMKTEPIEDLTEAIRRADRGGVYLSQAMATKVLSGGSGSISFGIDDLTNRERQVLERLGRGDSVEDIQDELDISRKTVETYRRRAKEKLGLDSTTELVQYALQWAFYPNSEDSSEVEPKD